MAGFIVQPAPESPAATAVDTLVLDGSYGEGGGQILRTALSLSVLTGRAFELVKIRAGRPNPGLQPQHLSALRAAAAISGAAVSGDQLGSMALRFAPTHAAKPGDYTFDVAASAGRGSAGAVSLILQTLLVPLALADGPSTLTLRGGTHVEWSPPFDDLVNGYLPLLRRLGLHADAELIRWGWYPVGQGEVLCRIQGRAARPTPLEALERGPLQRIAGRAVAANLPAHIAQRMADRARAQLRDLDVAVDIQPLRVTAACPGAGLFMYAEYRTMTATFSAYGRLGKPAETVADEAVAAFHAHHRSQAAVEIHLADQLLVPLAIASGPSLFTTLRPSGHLTTNAWTIGQFAVADVTIAEGPPCRVRIEPREHAPAP